MEEYTKSYRGLIWWIAGYTVAMFLPVLLVIFLPEIDGDPVTRLTLNIVMLGIVVMARMMYRNERIYWINGISYERAKAASSEQRKEYAMWYVTHFGRAAVIYLLYSVAAQFLHGPILIDALLITILLVVVAVKSVKVKLENF